jgi:uncharacterized membrane protein (DUF373 family)
LPASGGGLFRSVAIERNDVTARRLASEWIPIRLQAAIRVVEVGIYVAVAALLVLAAGFTLVGTVVDVIRDSASRPVADTGVFVLERVLLVFIIAELLYTLRIIDFGGRILVEPFLFIGLIAIVRRVLVVTAEVERGKTQSSDILLEIGVLGGLALVFAVAIHLLRRSAPETAEPIT